MASLRDAGQRRLIADNAHRVRRIDTVPLELDDRLSKDAQVLRDACQKGLIAHNVHRAKHIDTPPMELDDQLCQDAQVFS